MTLFGSEAALLDGFVAAVRGLDPDVMLGFEVQQGSLGFLVDRALALERPAPLLRELSRTPEARGPRVEAPCMACPPAALRATGRAPPSSAAARQGGPAHRGDYPTRPQSPGVLWLPGTARPG